MIEKITLVMRREVLRYMFALLQSYRSTTEIELRKINAIFVAIMSIVRDRESRKQEDERKRQEYTQNFQTQVQNKASEEMKALTLKALAEIDSDFDVYADESVSIMLTHDEIKDVDDMLHTVMWEKRVDKNKMFNGIYGSQDVKLLVEIFDVLREHERVE